MGLFRYDPARDLMRSRDFDRIMESWRPSIDVFERGNDMVLRADIPGIRPEDLDIRVNGDSVTLKGAVRREEHSGDEGYYYSERQYGTFYRSIPLPGGVQPEQSRATYTDGILELVMPRKAGSQETGHKVRIDTSAGKDDPGMTQ